MSRDKDSGYRSLTKFYHVIYRLTGILPYTEIDEANSWRRGLKNSTFGVYFLLVHTIYFTMHLGYVIRMILNHRLELDAIFEIVAGFGVFLRYVIIYLRRWDFLKLTIECRSFWRQFVYEYEAETVRVFMRKVYYLGYFFFVSTALTVTVYVITARFVRIPPVEANGTFTRILPMKFFVDVQDEPWYSIVSVLHTVLGYSVTTSLTGIEMAGPFLILMTCGYLKIINDRLINTRNDYLTDALPINTVLVCVQFHQAILIFCEKIEKFTHGLFMIQVLTTVYNMSLIAIKILDKDAALSKYVAVFGYSLLQFFTCQWIPQHLFDESEAVARAAYSAVWTDRQFHLKVNKILLMMLVRAGRPVQLTAGGIVRLSLECFKNMVVNAISFFTVLRSIAA